jgi:hypothetical protein
MALIISSRTVHDVCSGRRIQIYVVYLRIVTFHFPSPHPLFFEFKFKIHTSIGLWYAIGNGIESFIQVKMSGEVGIYVVLNEEARKPA